MDDWTQSWLTFNGYYTERVRVRNVRILSKSMEAATTFDASNAAIISAGNAVVQDTNAWRSFAAACSAKSSHGNDEKDSRDKLVHVVVDVSLCLSSSFCFMSIEYHLDIGDVAGIFGPRSELK